MTFLLHIIASIGILLPNILGYNLVFGKGKIFHFGPVAVSLTVSYVMFLLLPLTQSFFLSLLGTVAAALLLSLLFTWLSFRLEPDGLGILSLAVHLAVLSIVLNWTEVTRGALGIPRIPRLPFMETLPQFALVTSLVAAVWALGLWWIHHGPLGRQLAALSEQPWHAEAVGISRKRAHLLAFLIGGLSAVPGNVFYPQYVRLLHPSDYTYPFFIFFVMVVVAGKPGSVPGVVLSAILLIFLKEGIRFLPLPIAMVGPLRLLLYGIVLLIAVSVQRDTLFPVKRTV